MDLGSNIVFWACLTLMRGLGWNFLGALMLLFMGLYGLLAWQTRRHQAQQARQAHSVDIEAQDDGGYQIVE